MASVTIKQLLEAGVHFGHQTQRWNPKMKKFIFGERNGIYIINLEITLVCLEKALAYIRGVAGQGKEILFVGTKKQAKDIISEAAESCDMPYVNQRWLGGMLTNFETVRKSLGRIETIVKMEEDGSFQFVTKKEANMLRKEREKLEKNLKGIRGLKRLPGAVFVIDSNNENIAVRESRKLGIPVVAVLDTNCDPDVVEYPLPGNDDAIRAIKLFCDLVAEAVREGRAEFKRIAEEAEARRIKEEADEQAAAAAQTVDLASGEPGVESLIPVIDQIEEVVAGDDLKTKRVKSPKKAARKGDLS